MCMQAEVGGGGVQYFCVFFVGVNHQSLSYDHWANFSLGEHLICIHSKYDFHTLLAQTIHAPLSPALFVYSFIFMFF